MIRSFHHRLVPPCSSTLLALCCLLLHGCGKSGQLDTAPVKGTVTLDGKPVTRGMVLFTPVKGRGSSGPIQLDGSFTLTTYEAGDGAIVGLNKVVVIPELSGSGAEGPENTSNAGPASIPQKYSAPDSSGLSVEVKAGQQNQAALALSSK